VKVDEELVRNTLMVLKSHQAFSGAYPVHTQNVIARWEAALAAHNQIDVEVVDVTMNSFKPHEAE
jgi:ABC-type uncharacterized transport system auxiliary subunit